MPSIQGTPGWNAPLEKRFIFPLVVLILSAILLGIPFGLDAQDFEVNVPVAMSIFFLTPPLTLLLLMGWWLFFSGLSWTTRLSGLGAVSVLLLAGVGFFLFSVRNLEFGTTAFGLRPRVQFVW